MEPWIYTMSSPGYALRDETRVSGKDWINRCFRLGRFPILRSVVTLPEMLWGSPFWTRFMKTARNYVFDSVCWDVCSEEQIRFDFPVNLMHFVELGQDPAECGNNRWFTLTIGLHCSIFKKIFAEVWKLIRILLFLFLDECLLIWMWFMVFDNSMHVTYRNFRIVRNFSHRYSVINQKIIQHLHFVYDV